MTCCLVDSFSQKIESRTEPQQEEHCSSKGQIMRMEKEDRLARPEVTEANKGNENQQPWKDQLLNQQQLRLRATSYTATRGTPGSYSQHETVLVTVLTW